MSGHANQRRDDATNEAHNVPAETADNGSENRRRNVFRRFRRPLIGLSMIGAAAPLGRFSEAPAPVDEPDPARATPGEGEDAEEELAGRIGALRASGERNNRVINAVQRFDIPLDLAEDIYDVAREEGVEPEVAFGLVRTESTFREKAVSRVGARGLTQLMPRTARWLVPGTSTEDLFDRRTNLRLGFRYLDQLIRKYGGNLDLALTAYNRGPGTVDRVMARGGNPDNGYADRVLGRI
jgi:hypothetical protein